MTRARAHGTGRGRGTNSTRWRRRLFLPCLLQSIRLSLDLSLSIALPPPPPPKAARELTHFSTGLTGFPKNRITADDEGSCPSTRERGALAALASEARYSRSEAADFKQVFEAFFRKFRRVGLPHSLPPLPVEDETDEIPLRRKGPGQTSCNIRIDPVLVAAAPPLKTAATVQCRPFRPSWSRCRSIASLWFSSSVRPSDCLLTRTQCDHCGGARGRRGRGRPAAAVHICSEVA